MKKENNVKGLGSDDTLVRQQAAKELWDRYSQRLLTLAVRNLDIRVRSRVDEEDVLQSMYKSFCIRAKNNEFDLGDADDIWALLATMTIRKAKKAAAKQRAQKRNVRSEVDLSKNDEAGQPDFASEEPTAEEVAIAEDEIASRLSDLPEELQNLVRWKLEGYTNAEIAGSNMLDCSERTVERKLQLVRRKWT